MSFLVVNCFHWIGFHIVNYLLEQGYRVHGIGEINSKKQENLSMFFGRNDLFELNPDDQEKNGKKYETAILVEDDVSNYKVESNRTIKLSFETAFQENDLAATTINLPLLFGEWMEMNEEGFYHQNKFVRFDSDQFLTEAIYIEDFINSMMSSLKSTQLPACLEVKSAENTNPGDETLEKLIYVRDNKPIEENVKLVIDHFQKFKNFYE